MTRHVPWTGFVVGDRKPLPFSPPSPKRWCVHPNQVRIPRQHGTFAPATAGPPVTVLGVLHARSTRRKRAGCSALPVGAGCCLKIRRRILSRIVFPGSAAENRALVRDTRVSYFCSAFPRWLFRRSYLGRCVFTSGYPSCPGAAVSAYHAVLFSFPFCAGCGSCLRRGWCLPGSGSASVARLPHGPFVSWSALLLASVPCCLCTMVGI